eukprot:6250949-Pyramimonas_sp.AAC.1
MHIDPALSNGMKYGLIRQVASRVKPVDKYATWILGAFNCLDPGGSRVFLQAEPVPAKTDAVGSFFAGIFPYMCEVAQLYPTFRVIQDEKIISAGRLDRI